MKIFIAYKKRKGAWGGGNQFLSCMESEFDKENNVSKKILRADIILINSFTDIHLIINVLLKANNVPIVHRVDGPISKYRSDKFSGKLDDFIVTFFSNFITDASIFQSNYSLNYFLNNSFFKIDNQFKVIKNTAKNIFFEVSNKKFHENEKIKIVSSSWSKNKNKGIEYLIKLDKELDFSIFEFTFIGNIDYEFKNIRKIGIIPNEDIPFYLSKNHIYFSASIFECCSNSICEALAVGLPCVVHNSGGNMELIKNGGITFNSFEEALKAFYLVKNNYSEYKNKIFISPPKEVSKDYLKYFESVKRKFNYNLIIKIKRIFAILIILVYLIIKKIYNLSRIFLKISF